MYFNLNDYGYSYANAIGSTLKQPLFQLISDAAFATERRPWESQASLIKRIAYRCLVVALLIIPAGLAWFAGKAISHFSKIQIDPEGLSLAPPPIKIPEDLESDQAIDIMILAQKFNNLDVEDEISSSRTHKSESLARLCTWVTTEDEEIYKDNLRKRQLFCKQLSILLKGIIKKLDSNDLTEAKKRSILIELGEASTRCFPTWLQAATKLFAEANGQVGTAEVKLLRLVQDYKELIILEFCQKDAKTHWHVLNFVRNILGRELGLNTDLNAYDPYASQEEGPVFGKGLVKWMFLQRYENVSHLISGVQTMIEAQDYDSSYHDFLVKAMTDRGIPDPEDYVADHFYSDDFKLNELGVNFMLRSIGILK